MLKRLFLLTLSFFFCYALFASETAKEEEGIVFFTPPSGWHMADATSLPSRVRVMVVGSGPSSFPPSMNLSSEPYKGTLRQYLNMVKNLNAAQSYEWKDLGSIKTEAGNASLSQVDTQSQWGDIRQMHVILLKDGTIYILTASALKTEFSQFYKDFFAALRSLKVAKDAYEMIDDPKMRKEVTSAVNKLQGQWEALLKQKQKERLGTNFDDFKAKIFKSEEFQSKEWKPFHEMLKQKLGKMGLDWQSFFLQQVENQLLNFKEVAILKED